MLSRSYFSTRGRRDRATQLKSTAIIRASAQKILPMLIPALAAVLSVSEGHD